jgi:hypothetical protein
MTISIDESIQIFKAEIIAQDQRLSGRRSEALLEACACLKLRFKSRKNVLALLGMAEGVIQYLRKRGGGADSECLDFLKETLAHVVNIYEEGKFDPQREEQLGQRMYKHFTALRATLKGRRATSAGPHPQPAAPQTPPGEAAGAEEPAPGPPPADVSPPPAADVPQAEKKSTPAAGPHRQYKPQIGESFQVIRIGEQTLAVAGSAIALTAKLRPRRRAAYLASCQIPLKDFNPLFGNLSRRFQGPLSTIPAGRLKKLNLPLVTPKGGDLPELPEEEAAHLMIISHGQWQGVLFGRLETTTPLTLQRFEAAANGDIAGLGTMEGDSVYQLLNHRALLEREGFLAV